MYQQHVIDWWRSRGYRVTVLPGWRLMCVSETVYAMQDPRDVADAIGRLFRAQYRK